MESPQTGLITFKQLMQQCAGVLSEATLRRYIRDGRIECFQPAGAKGKLLFAHDAIVRLMLRNTPSRDINKQSGKTQRRPVWMSRIPINRKEPINK